MKAVRTLLLILLNGYILMFYSELVFWSRPRPEDSLPNWLATWTAYSLTGFLFLAAVRGFRVRSTWALFLCGALFGWLTEGVVVQTMYDAFPLQLSWTGLAWHALISVGFGWYWMRAALLRDRPGRAIRASLVFGLLWGVWAVFWWYEDPAAIAPAPAFGLYVLVSSLLLSLAYFLFDRLRPSLFRPAKWAVWLVALLFLAFFALVAVPAVPWAAAILPPLLALVLVALARNRRAEAEGSLLDIPGGRPQPLRYLAPLLAPLAAFLVYAGAAWLPWRLPTGWAVYLCTTPAGAVLFVLALVRVWRRKPAMTEGTLGPAPAASPEDLP